MRCKATDTGLVHRVVWCGRGLLLTFPGPHRIYPQRDGQADQILPLHQLSDVSTHKTR